MRSLVIAVAGLAWVAGCAQDPVEPILTGPLHGETFVDPEDPAVKACSTVVSLYTRSPVTATGMIEGPEGATITIVAGEGRYQCNVDARGRVTAMIPLSRG